MHPPLHDNHEISTGTKVNNDQLIDKSGELLEKSQGFSRHPIPHSCPELIGKKFD
jgi:hypothetical protein